MPRKEWDIWCSSWLSCATWHTFYIWTWTAFSFHLRTGLWFWPQLVCGQRLRHQLTKSISEKTHCKLLKAQYTCRLDIICCTPCPSFATLLWHPFIGLLWGKNNKEYMQKTKKEDGANQFTLNLYTRFQALLAWLMLCAQTAFWRRKIGNLLLIWRLFMEFSCGDISSLLEFNNFRSWISRPEKLSKTYSSSTLHLSSCTLSFAFSTKRSSQLMTQAIFTVIISWIRGTMCEE